MRNLLHILEAFSLQESVRYWNLLQHLVLTLPSCAALAKRLRSSLLLRLCIILRAGVVKRKRLTQEAIPGKWEFQLLPNKRTFLKAIPGVSTSLAKTSKSLKTKNYRESLFAFWLISADVPSIFNEIFYPNNQNSNFASHWNFCAKNDLFWSDCETNFFLKLWFQFRNKVGFFSTWHRSICN